MRLLFVFVPFLCLLSLALPFQEVSAACSNVIDDDSGNGHQSGWYEGGGHVPSYGDDYHISGDDYYVYDSRFYWSTLTSCSDGSGWWGVDVYLNNYDFTNTEAKYYKGGSAMNAIDQYNALGGWNRIETVWINKDQYYQFSVSSAGDMIYSGGQAYYPASRTGADALRLVD
ncbi:hypothetical protein [Halobacillus hunanensis]|uniref:hypothetical protein n=1 Tax=Halobacillus hunanensis TaxID=578214 RepID=UPI0009A6579E|nr:hypothetical protein [Halobacillus hunanensis]